MIKRNKKKLLQRGAYFGIIIILLFQVVIFTASCQKISTIFDTLADSFKKDDVNISAGTAAGTTDKTTAGTDQDNFSNNTQQAAEGSPHGMQDEPPETGQGIEALSEEMLNTINRQTKAMLFSAWGDIEPLYDIPFYDIDLNLDFEKAEYSGSERIYYTNLEDTALGRIYMRLFPNSGNVYGSGSLMVTSLRINEKIIANPIETADKSIVEIHLPQSLLPGQSTIIDLDFKGKIPEDFAQGSYGFFNKTKGTVALAGWFPILAVYDGQGWNLDPSSKIGDSVYSDMAFFSVNVFADPQLKVAGTGILENFKEEKNGKTSYSYISGPSRDFILVLSKDHKLMSQYYNGITFNCHYFENKDKQAQKSLETAIKSFAVFEEKFGKYPYREFDIIELPMKGVQGIEFPQAVLINSSVFGDDNVIVHEAAHQWWYNLVGNDALDNPWMDEALATYSQIIYLEETAGKAQAQGMLDHFTKFYKNKVVAGEDDFISEGLDYFEPKGSRHYSIIVYFKGAIFLNEIRKSIGDKDFYEALKIYYELNRYDIAMPDDLLDSFESASGKDLEKLYDEWLYSRK